MLIRLQRKYKNCKNEPLRHFVSRENSFEFQMMVENRSIDDAFVQQKKLFKAVNVETWLLIKNGAKISPRAELAHT